MALKFKYRASPLDMSKIRVLGNAILYQIGRILGADGYLEPHRHGDFFELVIITGGQGVAYINGERLSLKGGDAYLCFPGELHSVECDPQNPMSYDFVSIQTKDAQLRASMNELAMEFSNVGSRIIKSERIAESVSNLIAEIYENLEYSDTVIEALCSQIFVYILREFNKIRVNYAKNVSDVDILCYQLMNYIDTHIYTIKSLTEVCEITNYNYNYLSNVFKKSTSKTLMEYYTKRRLEIADSLIENGKHNITAIAEMLNYSSLYAFSRAYKKYFGISPSERNKKTK